MLDEAYESYEIANTLNLTEDEKKQLYALLVKLRDCMHVLSMIPKKNARRAQGVPLHLVK